MLPCPAPPEDIAIHKCRPQSSVPATRKRELLLSASPNATYLLSSNAAAIYVTTTTGPPAKVAQRTNYEDFRHRSGIVEHSTIVVITAKLGESPSRGFCLHRRQSRGPALGGRALDLRRFE